MAFGPEIRASGRFPLRESALLFFPVETPAEEKRDRIAGRVPARYRRGVIREKKQPPRPLLSQLREQRADELPIKTFDRLQFQLQVARMPRRITRFKMKIDQIMSVERFGGRLHLCRIVADGDINDLHSCFSP